VLEAGFFSDENKLHIKRIGDTDLQNTSIVSKQYTLSMTSWQGWCYGMFTATSVLSYLTWRELKTMNQTYLFCQEILSKVYDNSNLLPLPKE
jgi:hypothetical protein